MFEERLEVDEEFSHGGDDGDFVGLSLSEEALDVRTDDGVTGGGGMCGHVEAAPDFGTASADVALGGSGPTVAIEGSDAAERDELIAFEGGDLAQVGEEGPGGDFAHAFDGDEGASLRLEGGILGNV